MPGEYDNRLDKLESLIERTVRRVDEMAVELQNIRVELDTHCSGFKTIARQEAVDQTFETISDQKYRVIRMWNRLTVAEIRSRLFDGAANLIGSEIKDIRKSIDPIVDPILVGEDRRANLNEIEQRVLQVEEKIGA